MKVKEAAKVLGVAEKAVREMIMRGELEAKRVGKAYDIKGASVEAMRIYRGKIAERKHRKQQKREAINEPGKEQDGTGEERVGFLRGSWWF